MFAWMLCRVLGRTSPGWISWKKYCRVLHLRTTIIMTMMMDISTNEMSYRKKYQMREEMHTVSIATSSHLLFVIVVVGRCQQMAKDECGHIALLCFVAHHRNSFSIVPNGYFPFIWVNLHLKRWHPHYVHCNHIPCSKRRQTILISSFHLWTDTVQSRWLSERTVQAAERTRRKRKNSLERTDTLIIVAYLICGLLKENTVCVVHKFLKRISCKYFQRWIQMLSANLYTVLSFVTLLIISCVDKNLIENLVQSWNEMNISEHHAGLWSIVHPQLLCLRFHRPDVCIRSQ